MLASLLHVGIQRLPDTLLRHLAVLPGLSISIAWEGYAALTIPANALHCKVGCRQNEVIALRYVPTQASQAGVVGTEEVNKGARLRVRSQLLHKVHLGQAAVLLRAAHRLLREVCQTTAPSSNQGLEGARQQRSARMQSARACGATPASCDARTAAPQRTCMKASCA